MIVHVGQRQWYLLVRFTLEQSCHSVDVCVCHVAQRVSMRPSTYDHSRVLIVVRSLAYTFSAVVVVTNQVTTSWTSASRLHGGSRHNIASHTNSSSREGNSAFETEVSGGKGGDSYIIPALGNTWHHCVSNRLILEQHENRREMHLTKSPLAPAVSCRFIVQESGLEEVDVGV